MRILMLSTAVVLLATALGCAGARYQTATPSPAAAADTAATVRFAVIGDYGTGDSDSDNESGPAALVAGWASDPGLDFVITMGDNNYEDLSAETYLDVVCNYYGQFALTPADPDRETCKGQDGENVFFPSPGNHDWAADVGYDTYRQFFPDAGSDDPNLYYDFAVPDSGTPLVQFFAFNANCANADKNGSNPNDDNHGCPVAGSGDCADQYLTQAAQIRQRMAQTSATWNLVYFHQPPYSSTSHPGCPPIAELNFGGPEYVNQNGHGMTAVLSGHVHVYQRIVQAATPNVPFFVVGSSGRLSDGGCDGCAPASDMNCAYCYDKHHGAMRVTADSASITFDFYRDNGDLKDTCSITRDGGEQQLTCTGQTSGDYCGSPPSGVPSCG